MGALNLNPSVAYGAVRGMQDATTQENQQRAFDTDQAIQTESLKQSQETAPLRSKALQVGIQREEASSAQSAAEAPARLRALESSANVAGMTEEQQRIQTDAMKKATADRTKLQIALGQLHAGGDPQGVADTVASIYPEIASKNVKMVRNEDGSITMTADGTAPKVIKGGKTESGREYTAEEAVGAMTLKMLDPVKHAENALTHDMKMQEEIAKQNTIQGGRLAVARVGAAAKEDTKSLASKDRQHTRARQFVNDSMGSQTGLGALVTGKINDSELRDVVLAESSRLIEGGALAEDAVKNAKETVLEAHRKVKTKAQEVAEKLSGAGIDPRNAKAVADAAAAGNEDAVRLNNILELAKKQFGVTAQEYMRSQLKGVKKK